MRLHDVSGPICLRPPPAGTRDPMASLLFASSWTLLGAALLILLG
ncbi:hypothetical protein [Psychromarinibacter sp. S121]